MINKMSIEEFKKKLNETKHNTCGNMNKDDYYKYLDKLYNDYFQKVDS